MDRDNSSIVWVLVVIVILAISAWAVYAWYGPGGVDMPAAVSEGENENTGNELPAPQEEEVAGATITYSASGFSPSTVTIQRGETVTWQSDGTALWVASNEHPTHTHYSGTTREEHCAAGSTDAFDQCAVGNTFSFTFDQVGTWGYHNHREPSHGGQVIVVE